MADPILLERTAAMHRRLENEVDNLVGGGVLLEPTLLRRFRDVLDAAIPVADEYASASRP